MAEEEDEHRSRSCCTVQWVYKSIDRSTRGERPAPARKGRSLGHMPRIPAAEPVYIADVMDDLCLDEDSGDRALQSKLYR